MYGNIFLIIIIAVVIWKIYVKHRTRIEAKEKREKEYYEKFKRVNRSHSQDESIALKNNLKERANQNEPFACRALGDIERTGWYAGLQYLDTAFEYYKKGADAGDAVSMFWVGYFMIHNIGTDKKYEIADALPYLTKAANSSVLAAYELLGDVHAINYNKNNENTEDYSGYVDMHLEAAKRGSKYSLRKLLMMYNLDNPEEAAVYDGIIEKYGDPGEVDEYTFPAMAEI